MTGDTPPIPRAVRRWRRLTAALVAVALAVTVGVLLSRRHSAPPGSGTAASHPAAVPAGDELSLADLQPYGWNAAMAVGTRFTDGFNFVPISSRATGPLRIISVRPLMDDGGTLRLLGVLARVTPDMLPRDFQNGWFQSAQDFPPKDHDATGGVPPEGLIVQPPKPGDDRDVEIQIGYEVVAPGKSNKRGVEVRYEYQGQVHRVVVPSHLSICAPATVACPPENVE